jgi:hypothetical protein
MSYPAPVTVIGLYFSVFLLPQKEHRDVALKGAIIPFTYYSQFVTDCPILNHFSVILEGGIQQLLTPGAVVVYE